MDGPIAARSRCVAPAILLALAFASLVAGGCAHKRAASVTFAWVLGGSEPAFDPSGPPDARRWALERMLTHGLVVEDSTGRIVPAAAESVLASLDSLTWTFRLRPQLLYSDGSPCRGEDFRRAMEQGLSRTDHATSTWLLQAVEGVEAVRVGKPLPPLGIETPDADALKAMRKEHNAALPMMEAIRTLNRYGLEVTSGIILGLDTDTADTEQRLKDFIELSHIPMLTINLLQALPKTPLWDRLKRDGRLREDDAY